LAPAGSRIGRRVPDSPLAATPAANRQPFLPVEPEDLLVVRIKAFTLEQDAQTAIAEPAPLARKITQACS
jgi:hypothetical protein